MQKHGLRQLTVLGAALLMSLDALADQQLPLDQRKWEEEVVQNRYPLQPYPGSGTPASNARTEQVHLGFADQDAQFWEDRMGARAPKRGKAGRYGFTTVQETNKLRQGAAGTGVISVYVDDVAGGAQDNTVKVRVKYTNVELVEPERTNHEYMIGKGHLVYQLDDRAPIITADPTLELEGVAPGKHVLVVALSAGDGTPLGAWQRVDFEVP
ncbi:MAG: hypothetical protein AB2A00_04875 [Myxococcota bacterium]